MITEPEWTPAGVCILGWRRSRSQNVRFEPEQEQEPESTLRSVQGEREREFIGTNIKQFHAKIKLRRWDTEKNLQNRLSRRAPLKSFINFYRGIKLMAELMRI